MTETAACERALLLRSAAAEVLETMFFEELLGCCAVPAAGTPLLSARIVFSGSPSGVFELWLAEPVAARLASGFLAVDEEEADGRTAEVVAELANMICGSALSRLEKDAIFALDPPQPALKEPDEATVWTVLDGEQPLGLRLTLETDRC